MIEILFSGRWEKKLQRDESGHIFLDMNPDYFQTIVDYLVEMKYSSKEKLLQHPCSQEELDFGLHHMMMYFGIRPDPDVDDGTTQPEEQQSEPEQAKQVAQQSPTEDSWGLPNIDGFLGSLKKTMTDEQKALDDAKEELQKIKTSWEEEKRFIEGIVPTSKDDLVNLNVRGTQMTVRRSTLRIFKGSALDRQFDDTVWYDQIAQNEPNNKTSNEEAVEKANKCTKIPDAIANLFEKNEINVLDLLTFDSGDEMGLKTNIPVKQEPATKAVTDLQMMHQCSEVFIDHNEYCFRKIVDQLRLKIFSKDNYQPLSLSDITQTEQERFVETADYYFPGELAQLIWEKPMLDSNILSADQVYNIKTWLDEDGCGSDTKLLYRASRDGWGAPNFHAKCDNHGPTLTVIHSTEGYIFGGYCDTPWSGMGNWKSSPKAFIFTLKCFSGLPPTKMQLKQDRVDYAVRHNQRYGPIFGAGHDIHVYDNLHGNSYGRSCVGDTYECPTEQIDETFLTGARQFQISEVEVFRVH
uniref:TLDc domain-containing protein n=1 Tax=Ditylum brightwellii TaxID=49249 RepID=A0A7S4S2E5_9STRA